MPKAYDSLFKALADEDPRGLLFLFGGLPLEVPAKVSALPREVGLPTLQVDHVYQVQAQGRQWLAHFEAQTHYKPDLPERLVWYGTALTLRYRSPVQTTLVLLVERNAPAEVPQRHTVRVGELEITLGYRVVKLWKLEARVALESGDLRLLPWVSLMRASEAEIAGALGRIQETGDRVLAAQAYLLAGLRYTKGSPESVRWLERVRDMLSDDWIRESASFQMILDEGFEKGIEKGIEKGRVEEARKTLSLILALRFPALVSLVEMEKLADAGRLEDLLKQVVMASDEDTARQAILGACS